jgi:hypothetical protein
MKRYFIAMTALLSLVGCAPEEDVPGGEKLAQTASLMLGDKAVEFSSPTSISAGASEVGTEKLINYQVQLFKQNKEDKQAYLSLDNAQVTKYNETFGTSYKVLPSQYVAYNSVLPIKSGNTISEKGVLKLRVAADLEDNTPYMLALRLTSVSGAGVSSNAQTLLVRLTKVKGQINQTFVITPDEYFAIDKNSSSVDDIGNTFTLEGLINVQNFSENSGQAFISTFMGTEGGTLLRFGDTGNPANRLQTNGAGTELAVNFAVNKWYHVALVVNGNKTIAYINGEKVDEFAKNGRLGEFYIGRSYNGDRGIAAHFSELRLWKVARSAAQIKDNMYDVATNAEGLYAYWKMNKVENNKIPDVSGNGRELILRGQKNKNGRLDITIHNESKNVKIGE